MTQPITYRSRTGLLVLLLAPAVDRWAESGSMSGWRGDSIADN